MGLQKGRTLGAGHGGARLAGALFALLVVLRLALPGVHALQHAGGGEEGCGCGVAAPAGDHGGGDGSEREPLEEGSADCELCKLILASAAAPHVPQELESPTVLPRRADRCEDPLRARGACVPPWRTARAPPADSLR